MSTVNPDARQPASQAPEVLRTAASPTVAAEGPTPLDRLLGAPMFALTVLFLMLLAGALHLGTERLSASGEGQLLLQATGATSAAEALETHRLSLRIARLCTWALWCLYPLFVIEAVWHWRRGARRVRQHVWYCVAPPLRLGGRDHAQGSWTWLPGLGWSPVDDALRRRVERGASTPMLIIALLVLPLLAAHHYLNEHLQQNGWLMLAAEAGAALIWFAFTFEFIVMISLAPRRWVYARQHWLDLIIICFPMVAFLRVARLGSLLRMSRLARLQQLGRTLQVFRLRGTMLRLWKAVLLLELIDRVLRSPERRLASLRERLAMRESEIAELKREIAVLELRLAASADTADADGAVPAVPGES